MRAEAPKLIRSGCWFAPPPFAPISLQHFPPLSPANNISRPHLPPLGDDIANTPRPPLAPTLPDPISRQHSTPHLPPSGDDTGGGDRASPDRAAARPRPRLSGRRVFKKNWPNQNNKNVHPAARMGPLRPTGGSPVPHPCKPSPYLKPQPCPTFGPQALTWDGSTGSKGGGAPTRRGCSCRRQSTGRGCCGCWLRTLVESTSSICHGQSASIHLMHALARLIHVLVAPCYSRAMTAARAEHLSSQLRRLPWSVVSPHKNIAISSYDAHNLCTQILQSPHMMHTISAHKSCNLLT